MPGPMARAASVLGAKLPTARPSDVDVKLSRVRMPQNLANLRRQADFVVHAAGAAVLAGSPHCKRLACQTSSECQRERSADQIVSPKTTTYMALSWQVKKWSSH